MYTSGPVVDSVINQMVSMATPYFPLQETLKRYTGCPLKATLNQDTCNAEIDAKNIMYKNQVLPYLQVIHITNHRLQSWRLIHLYMPSHIEDIRLLFSILYTMKRDRNAHQNLTFLGCGDFIAMKHDVVMICQRLLILAQGVSRHRIDMSEAPMLHRL